MLADQGRQQRNCFRCRSVVERHESVAGAVDVVSGADKQVDEGAQRVPHAVDGKAARLRRRCGSKE